MSEGGRAARFTFQRASSFVYGASAGCASSRAFAFELAQHPVEVAGVLRVVSTLPSLEVRLSDSHNGRALRERFERRLYGVPVACLAQAVLTLPPTLDRYLAGRSRHAVRNNLSRARSHGLTVEAIADSAEARQRLAEVERRRPRPEWWIALGTDRVLTPELRWFAASAPDVGLLGVTAVCLDAEWAHLALLTCVAGHEHASPARYLLHTHVVDDLIRAGARYLNSDSGLRVSPGVRYLQQVLGYEVVNLRLTPALRRPPGVS